jgi:hypothetical protein
MKKVMKSSLDWAKDEGVVFLGVNDKDIDIKNVKYMVIDPDGWDRSRYPDVLSDPVDYDQFKNSLYRSTCMVVMT